MTEDHPLVPLTLYNKYKGMCEPLLKQAHDDDFIGVIFRPATVCGYAPRLRLDLSVNILTNHAVNNDKITVFGGDADAPNLHVAGLLRRRRDDARQRRPRRSRARSSISAIQNMSIADIALLVKDVVEQEFPEKAPIEIVTTPSNDNRSYHINSDKMTRVLGFRPKHTIEDAVRDLCRAFKEGKLPQLDDRRSYIQRYAR